MRARRPNNRRVTVCFACLRASCWQGSFYCDAAKEAGTTELTVDRLNELALEHPQYWRTRLTA